MLVFGLNNMIVTKGLTKVFKSFRRPPLTAVDNIDLTVDEGTIFGYLGPNGAGKTTTIKMLSTIFPPTSGTAKVCGYDILRQPLEIKKHIGLMPENSGFNGAMKALDVLMYYSEFYNRPKKQRRKRAMELLEDIGLGDAVNRKVSNFSHGMRKRLSLSVALFNEPDLLILDEPTSGLDPQGTYEFRNRIRSLKNEGITIFLSSHLLPEIEQICDMVGIINRGSIVDSGSIDNLKKKLEGSTAGMSVAFQLEGITEEHLSRFRKMEGVVAAQEVATEYFFRVDSKSRIPQLTDEMVSQGIKVYSINVKHVSLEDIFLSLTGGGGEGE